MGYLGYSNNLKNMWLYKDDLAYLSIFRSDVRLSMARNERKSIRVSVQRSQALVAQIIDDRFSLEETE